MYLTSISLSYFFLGIAILSLVFYLYFKLLIVKTHSSSSKSKEIIGTMKNPDEWRDKNTLMSYLSLFWAVISFAIFVWIKFLYNVTLISIIYPAIYILLIVVSVVLFSLKKKASV